MAEPVLTLDQAAAQDPAVSGGKGAALAKLVAADLPVPAGFIVTTHAFSEATTALLPQLEGLFTDADPADLAGLERASNLARESITSHRLPGDIVEAVHRAYDGLGAISVAARSSATAEDMPTASFAGQYDTFLNVIGCEALLERILHVWASLYSPHAVAYRRRQGIADEALRMAVIVQRLLPAEAAGVLFTRDPVSGSEQHFVVNAAFGLGEGVVDGTVPSDQFSLHPETGEVVAREVGRKEHMMAPARDGGLQRTEVEAARRAEPALSDQQLAELGRLAQSVRELFGGHQDIEFAVHGGSVHLLQARPVTGVADEPEFPVVWENPEDAKHTWLISAIGQRAVIPARRLEEDALRAYAESSRVCFEETGSPMASNHIGCFMNGYRYVRSPEVDESEIDERLRKYGESAIKYADRGLSHWEEVLQPDTERVLEELGRFRPRGATVPALVDHLERAIDGFAFVHGDLHWRLAAAGLALRIDWPAVYQELTGEAPVDAGVFLQAVENKTTRMVRWMRDLARLVQSDPKLREVFEQRAYDRLDDPTLQRRAAVRTFRSRFRNFQRRHGRRTGRGFGSATDFATPTWGMEPKQPLDIIASYAEQDIDQMERMESSARRERERATRRVRRSLASDPDKLARFDRMLFRVQEQVCTMENHNHLMEQATGGALREAIYWVGQRLVRDGLLDHCDDVLHLSLSELQSLASGGGPADLRALVRERQQEFDRRSRMAPPKTLGSGDPPSLPSLPGYDPPENAGRDGLLIRGVAASRGRVTGRARVVPPTAQPPDVKKGDILVAQNAGPNWTPVFPLLGGLVLDQGAVFQHAALVAREYRIPAVIMTKDATSAIRDGQTITVDGDQGVAELSP